MGRSAWVCSQRYLYCMKSRASAVLQQINCIHHVLDLQIEQEPHCRENKRQGFSYYTTHRLTASSSAQVKLHLKACNNVFPLPCSPYPQTHKKPRTIALQKNNKTKSMHVSRVKNSLLLRFLTFTLNLFLSSFCLLPTNPVNGKGLSNTQLEIQN